MVSNLNMAPAFIITFDDTTNNALHTHQQQIKIRARAALLSTLEQDHPLQISNQILQVHTQEA